MDMLYLKSVIMGIVEGLTEFLPVSSTGHLILTGSLLDMQKDVTDGEKLGAYEVVIQSGALLAVVWEFRHKFFDVAKGLLKRSASAWRFCINIAVAFMPAAIVGLLFEKKIHAVLFKPVPVALAFIIGAFIILWAERKDHKDRVDEVDKMTWKDALKIGFAQCFSLIPGTSRSGSTIIGAMLFGISRKAATEFSFFLAVPTLFAAGAYELFKERHALSSGDAGWFGIGFAVSFVAALFCVKWLLRYISTHDFKPFAWYRIAFGIVILLTAYFGLVDWTKG
jgi:undecaprenyl-diphosphatase